MSEPQLPLFELFTRLRQADIPLGIDEYQLLLDALQAGFGLADREELARLCRMLWIKSKEQERLFSYHFDQVIPHAHADESDELIAEHSDQLKRQARSSTSTDETDQSTYSPSSNTFLNPEDQAVQAVLHTAGEDELPYHRFVRSDEYFPVTRRQMKQSWRYLRRPLREGPLTELDIDATIHEVGRTGILLAPVLIPPRKNRAKLLLLIDQGGSMVPFHALSRRLAESALRGGRLGDASVYYFHNCPDGYLYREPTHRGAVALSDIFDDLHHGSSGICIFSDAGTARGSFSQERVEMTRDFLNQCARQFRSMVWLNPTPRKRWDNTTAGKLLQVVPMFDISRRGLDAAISLLRRQGQRPSLTQRSGYHG